MDTLQSKTFVVIQNLSRYFISLDINSRILSVSDFSKNIDVAQGTVQNALKFLKDENAIELISRGVLGTFLIKKDIKKLLRYADITFIVGVMPLPYSKLYEGLSTGILDSFSNALDVPVNMAYMRGALKRIEMVSLNRYDFAIVSKYAALKYMKENPNVIDIALEFPQKSFLKGHSIIFSDSKSKQIVDGMKVAMDYDSIDQMELTKKVCKNINVEYVPTNYSSISIKLKNKEVDVAIYNSDEVSDNLNSIEINLDNMDNTVAVIVTSKNRNEIKNLISDSINISEVIKTQADICSGRRTPQY